MAHYYYHGTTDTMHEQLRLLKPGLNEIPDELVPIAEACVEAGLLSHSADPPVPTPSLAPMYDPDKEPMAPVDYVEIQDPPEPSAYMEEEPEA